MAVSIVTLTEDYGSTGALTVDQVSPSSFTLYVYLYSDWQAGNQSPAFARGQTQVNSDGSWKTPIYVLAGNTYTVVVTNGTTVAVVAQHLAL